MKEMKAAWCVPMPVKGAGGFRTITQNAAALERKGFENDFYFLSQWDTDSTPEELAEAIFKWFGYSPNRVFTNASSLQGAYDLVIATFWNTARFVSLQQGTKIYFMQDCESMFYPAGGERLAAEETYGLGLIPITIGSWLATKCAGSRAYSTIFGANLGVYGPGAAGRERAVCAIFQPEKPRRASEMLLRALRMVYCLRPDVSIYLYGSDAEFLNGPEYKNLGLLTVGECAELYRRCAVGVCCSTSNPSRIPFEMMACGLPVVDLLLENNLYDLPGGAVSLAAPTSEGIASAIIELLDNSDRRQKMSEKACSYMQGRTVECESDQFAESCIAALHKKKPPLHAAIKGKRRPRASALLPEVKTLSAELYEAELNNLQIKKSVIVQGESSKITLAISELGMRYWGFQVAYWPEGAEPIWADFQLGEAGEIYIDFALPRLSDAPAKVTLHFYARERENNELHLIEGFDISLSPEGTREGLRSFVYKTPYFDIHYQA